MGIFLSIVSTYCYNLHYGFWFPLLIKKKKKWFLISSSLPRLSWYGLLFVDLSAWNSALFGFAMLLFFPIFSFCLVTVYMGSTTRLFEEKKTQLWYVSWKWLARTHTLNIALLWFRFVFPFLQFQSYLFKFAFLKLAYDDHWFLWYSSFIGDLSRVYMSSFCLKRK